MPHPVDEPLAGRAAAWRCGRRPDLGADDRPVFDPLSDPAPADHLAGALWALHARPNRDPICGRIAPNGDDPFGTHRHGLREGPPAVREGPSQLRRLEIPAGVRYQTSTRREISFRPAGE